MFTADKKEALYKNVAEAMTSYQKAADSENERGKVKAARAIADAMMAVVKFSIAAYPPADNSNMPERLQEIKKFCKQVSDGASPEEAQEWARLDNFVNRIWRQARK